MKGNILTKEELIRLSKILKSDIERYEKEIKAEKRRNKLHKINKINE